MKSILTARHTLGRCCWLPLAIAVLGRPLPAEDIEPLGQEIYQSQCAVCHGKQGEGTDEYERALIGDLSVAQLAEVIAETMPAEDPGSLSAQQSLAVATYVHGTFYSAIARERSRPGRIELARLTVSQHRRALTDLIASFRGPSTWSTDRGCRPTTTAGGALAAPVTGQQVALTQVSTLISARTRPCPRLPIRGGSPYAGKARLLTRRKQGTTTLLSGPRMPPGCGSTTWTTCW